MQVVILLWDKLLYRQRAQVGILDFNSIHGKMVNLEHCLKIFFLLDTIKEVYTHKNINMVEGEILWISKLVFHHS